MHINSLFLIYSPDLCIAEAFSLHMSWIIYRATAQYVFSIYHSFPTMKNTHFCRGTDYFLSVYFS